MFSCTEVRNLFLGKRVGLILYTNILKMDFFAFNPNKRQTGKQLSDFRASLVYKVITRTARATKRNPVLKGQI